MALELPTLSPLVFTDLPLITAGAWPCLTCTTLATPHQSPLPRVLLLSWKFSLLTVNSLVMIPRGNSDHFVNVNIVLAIKWPESLDLKQNSHLEDEAHLDKVIELFTYKALLETRDCKQKS